jgi:ubiquinol-cytochrome c reductase cytochrome b subunit
VDNATLNRFFSLHYLLPFLIAGLALLHLVLLHMEGSSNPLGICSKIDRVGFYPYFVVKDILGLIFMIIVFFLCVCNSPNYLGHTDNYILANPLVTPTHIVPEWYFLPFYAILRSIPSKLGGVIFMLMAIIILMFLPLLYPTVYRNPQVKPLFSIFYWLSISNFLLLGWLGSQVVEAPFVLLGQLSTFFYFFYFIVILPVLC